MSYELGVCNVYMIVLILMELRVYVHRAVYPYLTTFVDLFPLMPMLSTHFIGHLDNSSSRISD
jgi:hypothetical protein